ncbi:hypothetical protein BHM03_00044265 [Ensete ventricosum]|uniref:Regulator of chromosome condensation 1/beta-lactamase-inhibitor protein II n=1 Tax=Ensete ventricosum TaxID=4639 RepID=A0A445MKU4_ENSVE|nr:hypothetical protein BHM03_00044265 [Ensete ventricosum]
MGSTVYGLLGNPQTDGRLPTRVKGKISNHLVEEISCGSYHATVLTSRTEVYTWCKGANGRLGHGDNDDRNAPTLVEALKDKQVKSVVCGASFPAIICLHKWGQFSRLSSVESFKGENRDSRESNNGYPSSSSKFLQVQASSKKIFSTSVPGLQFRLVPPGTGSTYRSARLSACGPPATERYHQKSAVNDRLSEKSTVGGRFWEISG